MKDFIFKKLPFYLLVIIGLIFACNKDQNIKNLKISSNSEGVINDRGLDTCCGSVRIFMRDETYNLPFDFQVWYLDYSGVWKSTPCIPNGTHDVTISACTNIGSPLLVVLTPCGGNPASNPLPNLGNKLVMSNNDNCGHLHYDPDAPCHSFFYGLVNLPVPLPGYGSSYYGPSQEAGLCCY